LKNIALYVRIKKELTFVYLVISDTTEYRTKGTLSQMNVNMNIKCGPCTKSIGFHCAHTNTYTLSMSLGVVRMCVDLVQNALN